MKVLDLAVFADVNGVDGDVRSLCLAVSVSMCLMTSAIDGG